MKNKLAENMLRFGPKNLTESEKKNLSKLVEQAESGKKAGVNIDSKLSNISIDIKTTNPSHSTATQLKKGNDWTSCLWGRNLYQEPSRFWAQEEPSPKFGTDLNGVTGVCYIVPTRMAYYVIGTEVSGTVVNPASTGKTVIYKFVIRGDKEFGEEYCDIQASIYPGDSFSSTYKAVYENLYNSNKQLLKDDAKGVKAIMQSLINLKVIPSPSQDNQIVQAFPNWKTTPWIRDYAKIVPDPLSVYLNLQGQGLV